MAMLILFLACKNLEKKLKRKSFDEGRNEMKKVPLYCSVPGLKDLSSSQRQRVLAARVEEAKALADENMLTFAQRTRAESSTSPFKFF